MKANSRSEFISTRTDFSSSRGMVQRSPEISEYKGVLSTNKYKLFDDVMKRRMTGSVSGKNAMQLWYELGQSNEQKKDAMDKAGIEIVDVEMEIDTCFKKGGIMDPRMGPIVSRVLCETCHQELGICPGHMGRIELAIPFIMHDGKSGILNKALKHALKCVCPRCSILLPSLNVECEVCKLKIEKVTLIFDKTVHIAQGMRVDVKNKNRNIVVGASFKYKPEKKKERDEITVFDIDSYKIYDIFTSIEKNENEEDIKRVMGTLTRPSCLCPQVLLVLPPVHRPDKSRGVESSGKRTVGGCTTSYRNVVVQNEITWGAYLSLTQSKFNACNTEERMTVAFEFCRRHNLYSAGEDTITQPKAFTNILERMQQIHCPMLDLKLDRIEKTMEYQNKKEADLKKESDKLGGMINNLFNGMEATSRLGEHAELVDFSGLWNIIDGVKCGGGKMGLPRSSALGKRTGFVARGVILPNSHLSLTQIGMPHSFMSSLSLETGVGNYNLNEIIDEIRNPSEKRGRYTEIRIVVNEASQYKGNFKWKFDSTKEDERNRLIQILTTYKKGRFKHGSFRGRRLLRDNDVVMVNRQPTLQRQNMQALRIVGVEGDCLIMNPEQAQAYNLDFDGDQMNVFVPQDEMARAELAVLHSPAALVATSNGNCILGPGPSTVLGMFVLTDPKFKMDLRDSCRLFSEIAATVRSEETRALTDTSYHIDRGPWMQEAADYETRYNTALEKIIGNKDAPWKQAVRELISMCLPHGFDATVYGKTFDKYTGQGKKYKANLESERPNLVETWARFTLIGVRYMVASADLDGDLVGVYIEYGGESNRLQLGHALRDFGLKELQDKEIIPRGAKTVSFGSPSKDATEKSLPVLTIKSGVVVGELPQLTGEMLKSLYNQVLHFGGGAGVIATMDSLQHIAHATMARLEMTASSPGDLFNSIGNTYKSKVERWLTDMAVRHTVSTRGKIMERISNPSSNLAKLWQAVSASSSLTVQEMATADKKAFLKLNETEQTYALEGLEPGTIKEWTSMNFNFIDEDTRSTVAARAFSTKTEEIEKELLLDLKNIEDGLLKGGEDRTFEDQITKKLAQMRIHRGIKMLLFNKKWEVLAEMNTVEKTKALVGIKPEDVETILKQLSTYRRISNEDGANIKEAVRAAHKETLVACQEAISDSIIPLAVCDFADVNTFARLVPTNSLDGFVYHPRDKTNASLESLITGGTSACVQAGAQFPKGVSKDLRTMGVAIGHLKKSGMQSAETINKSGQEAPGLRDWGFVADNYITGIRYFPNFLQSQQIGIRSELEGKQDVGKVGYSARKLLLALMNVVAGMCGEARYLAGKGQERIVQFVYGSDGQDPHKLIPLARSIDYDGTMTLAMSWGEETSIPYPPKGEGVTWQEYLKKQCECLLHITESSGKSINPGLLTKAADMMIMMRSESDNGQMNNSVHQESIEEIHQAVSEALKFTSPENHKEIGTQCEKVLSDQMKRGLQVGQLMAFVFGIVSRVETSQITHHVVDLKSAMVIAMRWEFPGTCGQITDDSPLWTRCPLIRSNELASLLGDKDFYELVDTKTVDVPGLPRAIYDSMGRYWGKKCELTLDVMDNIYRHFEIDKVNSILALYRANMLLEKISCPLVENGTPDVASLQKVHGEMVRNERCHEDEFKKQYLLKCFGDILSGNTKNETLLDSLIKSGTVKQTLSTPINGELLVLVKNALGETLRRLPSKHESLLKECENMVESSMKLYQVLAFVCIVVNRLEYSRIEYGAPVGGWAVEALMADIQQAALDAKHGKTTNAKDRFQELVEFPYPNGLTVTFENYNCKRFGRHYFEDTNFSAEMRAYSRFYIHGRADQSIKTVNWWGTAHVESMKGGNISGSIDPQFSRGVGVCIEFSNKEVATEFCLEHLQLPSYSELKPKKNESVWKLSMGAEMYSCDGNNKWGVHVACTSAEAPLHRVVRETNTTGTNRKTFIETAVKWLRKWGSLGDNAIKFLVVVLLQSHIQCGINFSLLHWWKKLERKVLSIRNALCTNDNRALLKHMTGEAVHNALRSGDLSKKITLLEKYIGDFVINLDLMQYIVSVVLHHTDTAQAHEAYATWKDAASTLYLSIIESVTCQPTDVWAKMFKDPIDAEDLLRLHLSKIDKSATETWNNASKYYKEIKIQSHCVSCVSIDDPALSEVNVTVDGVSTVCIIHSSSLDDEFSESINEKNLKVHRNDSGEIVEGDDNDNDNVAENAFNRKDLYYYEKGEEAICITEMIEREISSPNVDNDLNAHGKAGKAGKPENNLIQACMKKLDGWVTSVLKHRYGPGIPNVVEAYARDKGDDLRNVWCLRFEMNDSTTKASSHIGQTDEERKKEQMIERERRTRGSPLLSIAHKMFTNKSEPQSATKKLDDEELRVASKLCNKLITKKKSYEEIMESMELRVKDRDPDTIEAYLNEAKAIIKSNSELMEKVYVETGFGCPYPKASSMSLTLDVDNPSIMQAACGIEIARLVMRQELDKLFAKSDADPRHAQLLADTLSIDGFLRGIRRCDVAEVRTPLELSAYERIQNALNEASIKEVECDEDTVHVAAMYNRPPQLGTGLIGSDMRRLPQCHNLMSVITNVSPSEPNKPPPPPARGADQNPKLSAMLEML